MMQPRLGIVGGYGPASSAKFCSNLISYAQKLDQEFGPTFTMDHVGIPMDLAALSINGDKEGTIQLINLANDALERLAKNGVTHVAIPCNTLHAFPDTLLIPPSMTLQHIADVFQEHIATLQVMNIGILASGTTIKAGFYQNALRASGKRVVTPPDDLQQQLNEEVSHFVAWGTVSEECKNVFERVFSYLEREGIDTLGLCCTDISSILEEIDTTPHWKTIDSMDALAEHCAQLSVA